jgi:hypothetical protein
MSGIYLHEWNLDHYKKAMWLAQMNLLLQIVIFVVLSVSMYTLKRGRNFTVTEGVDDSWCIG